MTVRFNTEDFDRIASGITTCVETGLMHGEQLELCAEHFDKTIGIELDESLAHQVQARVQQARVIHGDSGLWVAQLAEEIEEPVVWMLDAHYCRVPDHPINKSRFPLWDELIAIRARKKNDVVIVDDVHTFGRQRDDLRFDEAVEWEGVTGTSIASFFGRPLGEVVHDGYVIRLG